MGVRDALGRATQLMWSDGSLAALLDAKQQKTSWMRDVQGRITAEVRADGTTATTYTYETGPGVWNGHRPQGASDDLHLRAGGPAVDCAISSTWRPSASGSSDNERANSCVASNRAKPSRSRIGGVEWRFFRRRRKVVRLNVCALSATSNQPRGISTSCPNRSSSRRQPNARPLCSVVFASTSAEPWPPTSTRLRS